MHETVAFIFWLCVAAVVYSYALYAFLIWGVSRIFGARAAPPDVEDTKLPTAALLISAYNEERVITQRVRNALETNYPSEKFQVVVGSDGSSDRTVELLGRFESGAVRTLNFAQRRGKASVLNDGMQQINAEIVVLSDANTFIDPAAVRRLVRWFTDATVGVVCGRLVLSDPQTGGTVDSTYWKYETFLKRCEASLGGLLGSNGAIYAIRRTCYRPIPSSTIVDDFVIPLLARLGSGCRILYDSEAVAREEAAPDIASEFRRRSRIGAGGFQAIALLWRLLDPRCGWIAFTFLSHKILRWLCPFFLLLAFAANLALLGRPLYRITMAAQLAFYVAAILGQYVPKRGHLSKVLRLANLFANMNAALLVGFFRWISGPQTGIWRPTRRAV